MEAKNLKEKLINTLLENPEDRVLTVNRLIFNSKKPTSNQRMLGNFIIEICSIKDSCNLYSFPSKTFNMVCKGLEKSSILETQKIKK